MRGLSPAHAGRKGSGAEVLRPFLYFDESQSAELIKEWSVKTVPSLFLVDGGVPFAEAHGFQPQEILEYWIEYKLQEHKNGR